jgi:hypothetical protein
VAVLLSCAVLSCIRRKQVGNFQVCKFSFGCVRTADMQMPRASSSACFIKVVWIEANIAKVWSKAIVAFIKLKSGHEICLSIVGSMVRLSYDWPELIFFKLGFEVRIRYVLLPIFADQAPRWLLYMSVFYSLCQCSRLLITGYSKWIGIKWSRTVLSFLASRQRSSAQARLRLLSDGDVLSRAWTEARKTTKLTCGGSFMFCRHNLIFCTVTITLKSQKL